MCIPVLIGKIKKLLTLAILSTIFFVKPCFGVDFIKDRIYTSFSTNSVAIGYHYTDEIKVSVESMIFFSNFIDLGKLSGQLLLQLQEQSREWPKEKQLLELGQKFSSLFSKDGLGIFVNLHYHYKFTNTDITSYISTGIGTNVNMKGEYGFSYKISSGANLPLSSRTNIFAGYRLLKAFKDYDHGLELGISFNL